MLCNIYSLFFRIFFLLCVFWILDFVCVCVCVLFTLFCYLFPIFVQVYRPLPPVGNTTAVSIHHIIPYHNNFVYGSVSIFRSIKWEIPYVFQTVRISFYVTASLFFNENILFLKLGYPLAILGKR